MNVFGFKEKDYVLFVGEGNFTFSHSLIKYMQNNLNVSNFSNVYVTCLENEKDSLVTEEVKFFLTNCGTNVLYAVDATKLPNHPFLQKLGFNKIIFNFPHVGGKMKIHLNRQLLQDFFSQSSLILADGGDIIVTLCEGQGGTPVDRIQRRWDDTWQVVEMAARSGLVLREATYFPSEYFDNYISVGYRGKSKSFNTKNAIVHSFQMGKPFVYNIIDDERQFVDWHLYKGVFMSIIHKKKLAENPLMCNDSPQSYLIDILKGICSKYDSNYVILSEAPLFYKSQSYANQAECIVSGEKLFLRRTLLQDVPNLDKSKNCILQGLGFNQTTEDFSLPPAECHVALFGPLRKIIIVEFINEIKNVFHFHLHYDNNKRLAVLENNNWFLNHDELLSGIDINLDQILAHIFDCNWRQLWSPEVCVKHSVDENPRIIFPSICFQTFTFDISFRSRTEPLDVKNLLILVQKMNYFDCIESASLLNIYEPNDQSKIHCFRFIYRSYYSPLCRKDALLYHNFVGKTIEKLMDVEIV